MSSLPCGADTLVREMPKPGMAKASLAAIIRSFTLFFTRFFNVLVAALQEIFDEAAYQRFLNRKSLKSSRHAYSIFCQENEQAKSQRPRCC